MTDQVLQAGYGRGRGRRPTRLGWVTVAVLTLVSGPVAIAGQLPEPLEPPPVQPPPIPEPMVPPQRGVPRSAAGVVVQPPPALNSLVVPAVPAPAGVAPSPYIRQAPDLSGLVPERPPGPPAPRPLPEVASRIGSLIGRIHDLEGEIAVPLNQTRIIETRQTITRVVVGQPNIADVQILDPENPNPRILSIQGKGFGTTNLTVWDEQDRPLTFLLRVTVDTRDLEARLRQLFPGSSVRVKQVGMQLLLEGQVPDSKTMSDILQLIMTELRLWNSTSTTTQGGMGGGGMGGGTGGGGMGGGAGGMGGGTTSVLNNIIINRVRVPGPRQVLLKVRIAELNRTALRQIGVTWLDARNQAILGSTIGATNGGSVTASSTLGQAAAFTQRSQIPSPLTTPLFQRLQTSGRSPVASSFNAAGSTSAGSSQLFGVFNAGEFNLFINALRSNALAKILAEPNLMALDGQPARFLAGGQFPYPVPQSSSIPGGTAVVTVQFASFGAILQFIPHILQDDVIRLDVEPVFSQLNFGEGTTINGGRVPAIDQRSARTVVELREGQTLAIAGLLQTTTNAFTNRVPLLGDIPIVGPLFSSNQVETVETELVVLVTPELVAPLDPPEVPPAAADRVLQPNDFEFYFLGRIESRTGHDFRATVRELDPLNIMKHFESENHWVVGPHGYAD